ncbi:MAG: MATE family efflux transporter [Enterococcus sp.]
MKSLTEGNPLKVIFIFTIPLLIGNIFQQFYNMIDMIIVGQTLGKDALAAVGSTGSLTFLIIGFAQGLTSGLSIVTAQKFGSKNYREVKKSFATGIVISALVTVILTILSVVLVKPMLVAMQTPPEIFADAQTFITIIFGGMFAAMSFNLLSNVIRAIGDSRTPLVFLIVSVIINVILDFVFILYFKLGVAGAAYATVIAQASASLLCILYIKLKIPLLQLRVKDFTDLKKEFTRHLNIALPMAFQSSIIAIGAIILQAAVNSLGTDAVAAQSAASKIDQFAIQVMMSFGITMATFTAQNYGAKQYGRILQGVKQTLVMSGLFSLVIGAVLIFESDIFVQMFVSISETEVFQLTNIYFLINGSLYWVLAILFILRYTLQGLGQSKIPTLAGIMELVMRSFAAIVLTAIFGYAGAAIASPLAWIGSVSVLLPSYLKAIKHLRQLDQEQQLRLR